MRKMKKIVGCMLVSCMLLNTAMVAYAATATVCQGDTDNASDVELFETRLKSNGYSVTYKGFKGDKTSSSVKATGNDLSDAKSSNVLYWSSHGSSTPSLNVTGGPRFNTLDYFNPSKSSPLEIAIFSACYQLDGSSNRTNFANKMRNSNVRVIAGYHEQAPASQDYNLVDHYFVAVNGGNSVRYSWEAANAEVGKSGSWITLNYKDNYNEYYRMPGFPSERNDEYPTPTSSTPIYRYWGLSNPAAPVTTLSIDLEELPLRLNVSGNSHKVNLATMKNTMDVENSVISEKSQRVTFREPSDETFVNVDSAESTARSLIGTRLGLTDVTDNSLIDEYLIMCEEVKADGTEGSSEIIGKRVNYNNVMFGVPVEGNFISIGVDNEGIYDVIDTWKDLQPDELTTLSNAQENDYNAVVDRAEEYWSSIQKDVGNIVENSLIYVEDESGDYELSYSLSYSNGAKLYVSLYDLDITEVYAGN